MTEPDVTYQESAMVAMRHMDTEVRALVDYSIRLEKSNDELSDALKACRAKNDKLLDFLGMLYSSLLENEDDACDADACPLRICPDMSLCMPDEPCTIVRRMHELGVEL